MDIKSRVLKHDCRRERTRLLIISSGTLICLGIPSSAFHSGQGEFPTNTDPSMHSPKPLQVGTSWRHDYLFLQ